MHIKVRVGRTLTYMLYMIHITACTYYAYSDYQGNKCVFVIGIACLALQFIKIKATYQIKACKIINI